ncbi:hypothetical protein SAMN05444157_1181 [Frankineae bacterium MT45]|nr:hypothetical protein SAMN05444157_1181 [Frankineae bacterium MT45]
MKRLRDLQRPTGAMRRRLLPCFVIGVVLLGGGALSGCSKSKHQEASATISGSPISSAGTASAATATAATPATGASGTAAAPGSGATKLPSAPAGGASSKATPVNPTAGGAEGVTAGSGPTCPIISAAALGTAFSGRVSATVTKTSGVGRPLCIFTLATSNVGARGQSSGSVNMSLSTGTTPAAFAKAKATTPGAISIPHLGDDAYYVPSTSTLQVRSGTKSVGIQASMNTPAGTQFVKRIQADLVAAAKVIIAQL